MKRLINKLKEKPKLYKCLKILVVVGICLSLIFNAVIIGSAIAYSHGNSDSNKPQNNLVTTPVKRSLDYNGTRYLYSIEDIINSYTWSNYYVKNPQAFDTIETTQSVLIIADSQPWATVGDWVNVNWNTLSLSTGFDFNAVQFITTGHDDHFIHYQMRLVNSLNSQYRIVTTFTYVRPSNIDGGDFSGRLINIHRTLEADWCISLNRYDTPGLFELFETGISSGYNDGYMNGYNSGSSSGYRNGYTDGYNAGAGDSSATNDVFSIIASAFSSVASVLNIQLLPGLTLGLLIFTPVVIAVIIVVVKMIKG